MRFPYDLSHPIAMQGGIGQLQTLTRVPLIAGDSIALKLSGKLMLAPLRRYVALDPKVDLLAFYVPHRHVYGKAWVDFLQAGVDEEINLPSIDRGTKQPRYLGMGGASITYLGKFPRWCVVPYNQIWNRYFRVPSDSASTLAEDFVAPWSDSEGSTNWARSSWGHRCARLKTVHSTPLYTSPDVADRKLELGAPTTLPGATQQILDITDLQRIKARYHTEQIRDWFATRYADLLKMQWGGSANIDADQRPQLLARQSYYMSGHDIQGNDDATLGSFSGISESEVAFSVPRKYIPEHGSLWIMALLRFPTLYVHEGHYLEGKPNPNYKDISGEYELIAAEPPTLINAGTLFGRDDVAGLPEIGYSPFGQHYRFHPPSLHHNYYQRDGFPFIPTQLPGKEQAHYCQYREYDQIFQTQLYGQWQYSGRCSMEVLRGIPPAVGSIFAGSQ